MVILHTYLRAMVVVGAASAVFIAAPARADLGAGITAANFTSFGYSSSSRRSDIIEAGIGNSNGQHNTHHIPGKSTQSHAADAKKKK